MKDCVHKIPINCIDDLYGILEFKNQNKLQDRNMHKREKEI